MTRESLGWTTLLLVLSVSVAQSAPPPSTASAYKPGSGPLTVESVLLDWHDDDRQRDVPVKIYFPADGEGPYPVIIFSHGLGGSREGYEFLARHWASHGYVSVHPQHGGSDESIWRGAARPLEALRAGAKNLKAATDRPADVKFVITQLERLQTAGESPVAARLDLDRIGIGGHSFGAHTTMVVCGQRALGGALASTVDPRIKAALPLSTPAPALRNRLDAIYAGVKVPCLHMTGTLDDGPVGDTKAADRRLPFDHIRGGAQYLVTFDGGDHMIFAGRRVLGVSRGDPSKDERFYDLIRQGAIAFWDAYLKDDSAARAWLDEGGYEAELGDWAKYERRPPADN